MPAEVLPNARRRRIRGVLVPLAAGVAVTVVLLALVEGLASIAVTAYAAVKSAEVPRLRYTRYDADLGWVALPNITLPDIFGKGVYVRTDAKGFRNDQEFRADIPSDKLRVICSGGSFTFGDGVSDNQTWCQELAKQDPRIESLNMGQSGYGLDQAYLWYLRDGAGIAHNVDLFAFTSDDLLRIRETEEDGYGKPTLTVRNQTLTVENTPVPRLMVKYRVLKFKELGTVNFLEKVKERISRPKKLDAVSAEAGVRRVVLKIFSDLSAVDQRQNRLLVLVYLPSAEDFDPDPMQDQRRDFLRAEIAKLGIPYLDITEDLRTLTLHQMEELFVITPRSWPIIGVWGGYTTAGHQFIGSKVLTRLMVNQDFSHQLQPVKRNPPSVARRSGYSE